MVALLSMPRSGWSLLDLPPWLSRRQWGPLVCPCLAADILHAAGLCTLRYKAARCAWHCIGFSNRAMAYSATPHLDLASVPPLCNSGSRALQDGSPQPQYATAVQFLKYQRNKLFVTLRRYSEPKVRSDSARQHCTPTMLQHTDPPAGASCSAQSFVSAGRCSPSCARGEAAQEIT